MQLTDCYIINGRDNKDMSLFRIDMEKDLFANLRDLYEADPERFHQFFPETLLPELHSDWDMAVYAEYKSKRTGLVKSLHCLIPLRDQIGRRVELDRQEGFTPIIRLYYDRSVFEAPKEEPLITDDQKIEISERMEKSRKKRNKAFIGALLGLCLWGCILAGLVIRGLSIGSLPDIEDALAEEDYKQVVTLYNERILLRENQKPMGDQLILAKADQVVRAYLSGDADYEYVDRCLSAFLKMKSDDMIDVIAVDAEMCALNEHRLVDAVGIYNKHISDNETREKAVQSLVLDMMAELYGERNQDGADHSRIQSDLVVLRDMKNALLSEKAEGYLYLMTEYLSAKKHFELAETLYADHQYLDAIREYLQVSAGSEDFASAAQKQIGEAGQAIIDGFENKETMTGALAAIAGLTDLSETLPLEMFDTEVTALKAQVQKEVLEKVDALVGEKKYDKAMKLLRDSGKAWDKIELTKKLMEIRDLQMADEETETEELPEHLTIPEPDKAKETAETIES